MEAKEYQQKVVLVCDNGESFSYQSVGEGIYPNVHIQQIDKAQFIPSESSNLLVFDESHIGGSQVKSSLYC